jgi:hypothetical protein
VNTAFNQPGDESSKFQLIDLAPFIQGHQQWGEYAVEPRQATRIHGSAPFRRFTFWNCGFVNVNHSYVDCDVFVTVAKYKDHPTTGVSTVMKNLFGLTPLTVYGNGVARASGNADDN